MDGVTVILCSIAVLMVAISIHRNRSSTGPQPIDLTHERIKRRVAYEAGKQIGLSMRPGMYKKKLRRR